MTVHASPASPKAPALQVKDGRLLVGGACVLEKIGTKEIVCDAESEQGGFLRLKYFVNKSINEFDFGAFPRGTKALACCRQKLWMAGSRVADCDSQHIPFDTQYLLLQLPPDPTGKNKYAAVLPMVTGPARSTLNPPEPKLVSWLVGNNPEPFGGLWSKVSELIRPPSSGKRVVVLTETGDTKTPIGGGEFAYVRVGDDPFALLEESFEAVSRRTGTFTTRKHKTPPKSLELFGWCTWNGFYVNVTADGIEKGLTHFKEGGTPARFLLIDDGWQDTTFAKTSPEPYQNPEDVVALPPKPAHPIKLVAWLWAGLGRQVDRGMRAIMQSWFRFILEKPFHSIHFMLFRLAAWTVFRRAAHNLINYAPWWHKALDSPDAAPRFAETIKGGGGMSGLVKRLKGQYGVKTIYCWHSIVGYWCGISEKYAKKLDAKAGVGNGDYRVLPQLSWPVFKIEPVLWWEFFISHGFLVGGAQGKGGMKQGAQLLYEDMHSTLKNAGVDGVKIDHQGIVVTMGEGRGGAAKVTGDYVRSLEDSVQKHFGGEGVIGCMCASSELAYNYKSTNVVRVGDDFWPDHPPSHTVHVIVSAYNSLFMGQFANTDWDMFFSKHRAASLHACVRAVGGCGVYVSDKPGEHNFDILKRLVFPDGTTLRALNPGKPTRDCLFVDAARDEKTALKIWNVNRYTGIVGGYNVQGHEWNHVDRTFRTFQNPVRPVTTLIKPTDCEDLTRGRAKDTKYCVFTTHWSIEGNLKSSGLRVVDAAGQVAATLEECEAFLATISPLAKIGNAEWVPIGLKEMFNAGGAIMSVQVHGSDGVAEVVGEGDLIAYASSRPKSCAIDGKAIDFTYSAEDGCVTIRLPDMDRELPAGDDGTRKTHTLTYMF